MKQAIEFKELLEKQRTIEGPDKECYLKIKKRWDCVAKPLDSLGKFETVTARMGAITGSENLDFEKKAILVFCADNGVVEEGISQSGQDVTLAVTKALGKRKSSVCKMAAKNGVHIIPVDIGVNTNEDIPGVLKNKVCRGTRNFAKEPAMTTEETLKAIQIGMNLVLECKKQGYQVLGTGEMGIGNTTTSCAIVTALLGCDAKEIVGRGAGLSDEGLRKKEQVIQNAVNHYGLKDAKPLEVLETVGGLDLAAITGVIIGGALYHIPIVMDGVITLAAALVASRMFPVTKEYLIASHIGKEPAMKRLLEEMELSPVICGELALGEGTGAVMFFAMLDLALALYTDQYTFGDMEIEPYKRFGEE